MAGIHIPADGLPRDYELLRGNGVSDASRRHRHSLLGIILVILHINIIFCVLFGCYMSQYRGDYNQRRMQALEDTVDMLLSINKLLRSQLKEEEE